MRTYKMPNLGRMESIRSVQSVRANGENPAHKVLMFEKGKVLTSYESVVVVIHKGEIYLGNDHDYSMTTKMYVNKFLGIDAKEFKKNYTAGEYKLISI